MHWLPLIQYLFILWASVRKVMVVTLDYILILEEYSIVLKANIMKGHLDIVQAIEHHVQGQQEKLRQNTLKT